MRFGREPSGPQSGRLEFKRSRMASSKRFSCCLVVVILEHAHSKLQDFRLLESQSKASPPPLLGASCAMSLAKVSQPGERGFKFN